MYVVKIISESRSLIERLISNCEKLFYSNFLWKFFCCYFEATELLWYNRIMSETILAKILDKCIETWASDIHLSENKLIIFRVNGKLENFHAKWVLHKSHLEAIILELFNGDTLAMERFVIKKDMDFSYLYKQKHGFRINAFLKLWKLSLVMRQIASKAKTIQELGLPSGVAKFTQAKQWLILITWPTGSWKSTSMVAILDQINETRTEHILTIEDPIEFIFEDKKSIFSQREVWKDTNSFSSAMRSAFREDPDIIVVGELRDKETISLAIELAETGHLVFGTLHTSGSVSTISRIISFFPASIQNSIYARLGECLCWVLSQRLIPLKWKEGRVGIYELMIGTLGIRNIVSSWQLSQMESTIETGKQDGMITMQEYAQGLFDEWKIEQKDYIHYFKDRG